jgi:aspartyl-tRNA(Asn)/glutamyl-tRNA(Gln) amidotransferase subunit A
MSELWELSAEEIATKVKAREVSAEEVLQSVLARTSKVEPLIAAYLDLYPEDAQKRAREVDRKVACGEDAGLLAGVPVALKDNLSVHGWPLTCGSKILAGYVAPYTATAVERLLAAGAVPIGRANMDEFAMGSSTENSAYQVTRNPWDLRAVPGGSSGGPAAAVAAGSVPLALGSDTGGSIRQPAALCGVVGLKPTYGRVSRYGLVAFASSTDQIGPISRSVRDSALALSVIAGADPRDTTTVDVPVGEPLGAIEDSVRGIRVGIVSQIEAAGLASQTDRNWRASLSRLESLGAEITPVSLPSIDAAVAVYYVVATSEASANLSRFDGIRYGRRSPAPSSLADLYVQSRSEGFGAEVKRRIMLGTFALSSGYYEAYYGRARGVLEQMRRELDTAFEEVDVIVTPTTPEGAFRLGAKVDDPLSMYLNDIFTTPASLVGLPALAVPSGSDDSGLPLSLQFIGQPFDEPRVLRIARAFERQTAWRTSPQFHGAGGD